MRGIDQHPAEFPAPAGINPDHIMFIRGRIGVPRASGDKPYWKKLATVSAASSPRQRG
ncbi:hypothetical protein AWD85_001329 [Escherichia coli]|nr:hypothetical protein [Escherichia coli]EFT0172918.1 hypothetical protein [Escherichia coli]